MPDRSGLSPAELLYREVVLEHYRNPRNRRPLPDPKRSASVRNPLCGDQVDVEVSLEGDRIQAVCVRTRGCSIAVAAGSVMTELLDGEGAAQVAQLQRQFESLLETGQPTPELPELLRAFEQVSKLPTRKRCALLPWEALRDALDP